MKLFKEVQRYRSTHVHLAIREALPKWEKPFCFDNRLKRLGRERGGEIGPICEIHLFVFHYYETSSHWQLKNKLPLSTTCVRGGVKIKWRILLCRPSLLQIIDFFLVDDFKAYITLPDAASMQYCKIVFLFNLIKMSMGSRGLRMSFIWLTS